MTVTLTSFPAEVAITINSGPTPLAPGEILNLLSANGVPEEAVCVAHVDRTFSESDTDVRKMSELCQRGCYVDHSLFGKECSHYSYGPHLNIDFPSDAQKIQRVKKLLASGCGNRLLISHDIVCKHEWSCYGGTGYGHLLQHIAPKFVQRGVEATLVDRIMRDNPRDWLTCSNS
jgi:phosphotriesterase-related protein